MNHEDTDIATCHGCRGGFSSRFPSPFHNLRALSAPGKGERPHLPAGCRPRPHLPGPTAPCRPLRGAAGPAPEPGAGGAATGSLRERSGERGAPESGGAGRRRGPGAAGASGSPCPSSPCTRPCPGIGSCGADAQRGRTRYRASGAPAPPPPGGPVTWGDLWSGGTASGMGRCALGAPDAVCLGKRLRREALPSSLRPLGKPGPEGVLLGAPSLSLCCGYPPRI